ncbi:MAG: hypothetical protein V1921_06525 [Candidatus Altiarchaeota archaeon]
MTGTKIVKLNLDGAADKLPALREDITDRASNLFKSGLDYFGSTEEHYKRILKDTGNMSASNAELQLILCRLEEEHGEQKWYAPKAGIFLSAFMQNSQENKFRIVARKPLDYLGYKLGKGKQVTVDGDVGDYAGAKMDGGSLTIKGNAGIKTGYMLNRGEILVEGDSGDSTGENNISGIITVGGNVPGRTGNGMKGGKVTIKGNAGRQTGYGMKDGIVHVHGDMGIETGASMFGGRIEVDGNIQAYDVEWLQGNTWGKQFFKGEIWNKGKRVWPKEE